MKVSDLVGEKIGAENMGAWKETMKDFLNDGLIESYKEFCKEMNAGLNASYIHIDKEHNTLFFYWIDKDKNTNKVETNIYDIVNYAGKIPLIVYAPFKGQIMEWQKNLIQFTREEGLEIIILHNEGKIRAAKMEGGKISEYFDLAEILEAEVR